MKQAHQLGWQEERIDPDTFYGEPSRSAQKREAKAKTEVVDDLLALNKDQLKKFACFDESFLDALALMKRMAFGPAYRRQRNYLGKRIREAEWYDEIQAQLDIIRGVSKQAVALHHRCEQWRDRLIAGDDSVLSAFLTLHPEADRQQLRQTIRLAKQELAQEKPPKQSRLLFKQIRALQEAQLLGRNADKGFTDEDDADDVSDDVSDEDFEHNDVEDNVEDDVDYDGDDFEDDFAEDDVEESDEIAPHHRRK
jgi:ribosome-associated protein